MSSPAAGAQLGSTVASTIPRLKVNSHEIDDPGSLISLLPSFEQLLWSRRGEGLIGLGKKLRFRFFGADRIRRASQVWKQIVADAQIDDQVKVPGSGLVAFGTFTFAADSGLPSILSIPERVIGRRNGSAWITQITADDFDFEEFEAEHNSESKSLHLSKQHQSEIGYLDSVATALNRIQQGELDKVVLARDLRSRIGESFSMRHTLDSLSTRYPDCWTFCIDDFFGASPETLVQVRDHAVSARVLAGSIARGVDAKSDTEASAQLVTSAKDQDEHEFAVRSVVSALTPHCRNVVSSEEPFTIKLPNLWHLASDVAAELADDSGSLDLADALHPTAAVAGSPKLKAIELISELEPFDRGRYAGPVGWIDANGDGDWAIALRCAQIDSDGAVQAIAGAGIVDGSIPGRELVETELKFKPIVESLGAIFD